MLKINKALLEGGIILFILFGLFNFVNFLFQSFMAYKLSAADYGILGSLYYIIYFVGIFSESIQTVITKYSSVELDKGKVKNIIKKTFKTAAKYSFLLFALYLLIIIPLSILTKINYSLFTIAGLIIFVSFFSPITRGVLQGKKMFFSLGTNLIIESGVKLIISVGLVLLGWKVYGAITGTVLGMFTALVLSFVPLKNIIKSKEKKAKTLNIRSYSKPVFVLMLSVLAFYTIDIIIAQIVFPKDIAGYYTIASVLSKVIFWGTQPISKAMFPLTANGNKNKSLSKHTYLNAILMVGIIALIALFAFYFFSPEIIKIFSGKIIPNPMILFYLGIGTTILSFANLNMLYKASLNKTNKAYLFLIVLAISIGIMFLFHSTIVQFSLAFLTASVMFLIASIILLDR